MEIAKIDKKTKAIKLLCPVCKQVAMEKQIDFFVCGKCGFKVMTNL